MLSWRRKKREMRAQLAITQQMECSSAMKHVIMVTCLEMLLSWLLTSSSPAPM